MRECYVCHAPATDVHHMIHGPDRKKADQDGLVCPLCRRCHDRVHFGDGTLDRLLKQTAQRWYEQTHSREEWMKRYGRNYLWEEETEGMKMLELTSPNGEKVYVNASHITSIEEPDRSDAPCSACVFFVDEGEIYVQETPETIARMCEGKTTLTKLVEETIAEVCDKICRYTHEPIPEGKDEDWLFEEGGPCDRCPLNKLGV